MKKAKRRTKVRLWKVLVCGSDKADDFVLTLKAHTADEAEMDAADTWPRRWVRAITAQEAAPLERATGQRKAPRRKRVAK